MPNNRILIYCDLLDVQKAGIYRALHGIINALHEYDHPFEIILLRRRDTGEFPRFRTLTYPGWANAPGMRFIKYFFLNSRYAKKVKADIVLEPAHFGPFNLPGHIKRVTFIHDMTAVTHPELHQTFSSVLQRLFMKKVLRKSDLILTNSRSSKEDITTYLPETENKTRVLRFGATTPLNRRINSSVLKDYQIAQPYFLSVGTIEPRKNYSLLLKAFDLFKSNGSHPHKLVIVGERGWKSEEFDQACASMTHRADVILTGFIPDSSLEVLYSMAELFIYPSLYEGFGIPVIESLCCGTPCLVASNSGLQEFDSPYVHYFDEKNEKDLADKMAENYSERPDPDEVRKQFDWGEFVRGFVESIR